jgi:hypothetical protein
MRMNIQRRHVDLDTQCAKHCLKVTVACPEAEKVWEALSLEEAARCMLLNCNSAMDLLDRVLAMPYDEKMMCVSFLWCWWTERHKASEGYLRKN